MRNKMFQFGDWYKVFAVHGNELEQIEQHSDTYILPPWMHMNMKWMFKVVKLLFTVHVKMSRIWVLSFLDNMKSIQYSFKSLAHEGNILRTSVGKTNIQNKIFTIIYGVHIVTSGKRRFRLWASDQVKKRIRCREMCILLEGIFEQRQISDNRHKIYKQKHMNFK